MGLSPSAREPRRAPLGRAPGLVAVLLPDPGVLALAVTMLAVSGVLYAGSGDGPAPAPQAMSVPLWLLALLFLVADVTIYRVRMRRGVQELSMSEIPLVLGLAAASPGVLILARFIGSSVAQVVRGKRGTKLIFNLAMFVLETAVAITLYRLLRDGAPVASARGWAAMIATVLLVDALATLLITCASAARHDNAEWRRLPDTLGRGVVPALTNGSIGLLAFLASTYTRYASLLILVVATVAYVAYRRYVARSDAHARVERLYEFTRGLSGALDTPDIIRALLRQARDELRAQTAQLILPGSDELPAQRWVLGDGGLQQAEGPLPRWLEPALRGESLLLAKQPGRLEPAPGEPVDAMAVPLPLEAGGPGLLVVTDSLPDIPTFAAGDLPLFEAMANHASVALANGRLVERLRRQASEQAFLAAHDALTGLPNRRLFTERLTRTLREAAPGQLVAVVLLDLDGFKDVNDTLGYATGNRILAELGARLSARVPAGALVACLGGDEFGVLLPDPGGFEAVHQVVEGLAQSIESPFALDEMDVEVRASFGVSLAPEHGRDTAALLRFAHVAMDAAKAARTVIEVYSSALDRNGHRRLALLGSLRRGIDEGQLTIAYQPQVRVGDGTVVSCEALVRWNHPEHGLLPPDEFIPLAEHSGLIRPLTLHVLETALAQVAAWRAAGHDLGVAVNLSARNLLDAALPDDIARLLARAGVPASALTLEITESSIMSDPTRAAAELKRISRLGVALSIDDFGTGYSSLAYLQRLPVDEVKIDKSFVLGLGRADADRTIVRAIVRLGHELSLRVVAEGVEDQVALDFLAEQRCDLAQGYFLARPLTAPAFEQWLIDRRDTRPDLLPVG